MAMMIKHIGCILDTEKYIKTTTGQSIDALNKYERVLCNEQTSMKLKIGKLNIVMEQWSAYDHWCFTFARPAG